MAFQGKEAEQDSTVLKLPLFSKPLPAMVQSPEHSGMLTPPLRSLASVPFQWEEEPGKPRPCTALIALPNSQNTTETKCLELPPRLFMESNSKITKIPSPTTVLDGPYVGRFNFSSSSFRSLRQGKGSFDSSGSRSPEKGQQNQLSTLVLLPKKTHKRRGLFDSWGKKALKFRGRKKEVGDDNAKTRKLTRTGSFSSFTQARSHRLWDAIYEGFKQVIPWKGRKSNKEKLIV